MNVQNFASEVIFEARTATAAFPQDFKASDFNNTTFTSPATIMSDGVEVAHAPIIENEKPRKVRRIKCYSNNK